MTRPNVEESLAPLKGFQRETVDYVFQRMYRDAEPAHRFLVADEVGLGKTLIARGILARAIDHLWDTTKRIDVVYICSSLPIARQNLGKLTIGGTERHELATRLTLLPRDLRNLRDHKVNFVSFTPSTSFDLKSQAGMADERVVLYWLLVDVLGKSAGLRNLLQGNVRDRERWASRLDDRPGLEASLVEGFQSELARRPELRERLESACHEFRRHREEWPQELREQRNGVLGDLRMLLARTCVDALEPDLIVLDEFQRFRDLLHGQDEMASLARSMWDWRSPETGERARTLLLSATPYRMYSNDAEVGSDDHYTDFLSTTRFLMDDDEKRVARFEDAIRHYRHALRSALRGEPGDVQSARFAVETELRRVMVRTERVAATEDRASMMDERRIDAPLAPEDLRQWLFVDELARSVDARDAMELWKSAPYLPQFMKTYDFKRKLDEATREGNEEVLSICRRHVDATIRPKQVKTFSHIPAANPRFRMLLSEVESSKSWQWLWVPPTVPYWPLRGAYADATSFTKSLIFSAWHVVPDAVSALLSYEVDRRMLGESTRDVSYDQLHTRHRGRLRYAFSDGRLTGMTTLALAYPSVTLADELSPLAERAAGIQDPTFAWRKQLQSWVEQLPAGDARSDERASYERPFDERPSDERWYWAASVLLDAQRDVDLGWLTSWSLHEDDPEENREDTRFRDHVVQLAKAARGELEPPLGKKPADLVDVLCDLALGAPGILAMRSLAPIEASVSARQHAAARVAEGFRSLFNQPTTMGLLDQLYAPDPFGRPDQPELDRKTPYWRGCARYAIDGCLQATLDEHFHQIWEQSAWERRDPDQVIAEVAEKMASAVAIRTSRVEFDSLSGTEKRWTLRTVYALRYGAVKDDDKATIAREGSVRESFNSPYRPFVLASTSIGQEGLDFHPWCHAIVHWNLPGNPVDLEQREGRVHRYEGHAVRKNVAAAHRDEAFARWRIGNDLWKLLFEIAVERRETDDELVPWWVYPGPHKVQRIVPCTPLSRELALLQRLRKDLVAYRLAFGQPRQQELLELVHEAEVGVQKMDAWALNLRPNAKRR